MALIKQNSLTIWLTGLPGSGKTTLALALEKEIFKKGYLSVVLDGDKIRSGINKDLGFTLNDRQENIRRVAEIARLFNEKGFIVICSFITPTQNLRSLAREIIGEKNFVEVFIDASLKTCIKRDPKGLYAKAQLGEIQNFTGIHSAYEEPLTPDIRINTNVDSVEESTSCLIKKITSRLILS